MEIFYEKRWRHAEKTRRWKKRKRGECAGAPPLVVMAGVVAGLVAGVVAVPLLVLLLLEAPDKNPTVFARKDLNLLSFGKVIIDGVFRF